MENQTKSILAILIGAVVCASLFLLSITSATAATPIYVRTDGNDTECNGTANVPYPGGSGPLNCAVATLQKGIDLVDPGGVVYVASGTYTLSSQVNLNKANITIDGAGTGNTIFQVSGTGYRFYITADGVTLQELEIIKTDKTGVQNIIYIGADNVTVQDCSIHGQYAFGDNDVTRAFEVAYGSTGLLIQRNTIYALRQPGYFNGSPASPTTGTIQNNTVYTTRGWVMAGANMTFTDNVWSSGGNVNYYDIAILSGTDPSYYPDIVAISNANNEAVIEDQRPSPAVLSIVHVDAAAAAGGDGSIMRPYQTITPAIARVVAGGTIKVKAGTYTESLTLSKSLTLKKDPGSASQPILNGSCATALIVVSASNVTIDNLTLEVNQSTCMKGIYASSGYDNLTIRNNLIVSTGAFTSGMVFNSYGIHLEGGGSYLITLQNNTIQPKNLLANDAFGRGVRLIGTHGVIGGSGAGNTISAFYAIQAADAAGGALEITHNTLTGQNEINVPGAGAHKFENNTCQTGDPGTGAVAANQFALLEVKNHRTTGSTLSIKDNSFSGYTNFAVFLGRSNDITVDHNTFTPLSVASNTGYRHVHVNTKERTIGVEPAATVSNIAITRNTFNGHAAASGGVAVEFANHHSGVTPAFQAITIGGAGAENTFKGQIATYFRLDPLSGNSNTVPMWSGLTNTTMAPVSENFDIRQNYFGVAGGDLLPTAMTLSELFTLEDKVVHKIDYATLGFALIKASNTYVTVNSYLAPYTTAASIQRGVDAASAGFTVNVGPGTFDDEVNVNKVVSVIGAGIDQTTVRGLIGGTETATFQIRANGVLIEGFTITRNGNNPTDWNNNLNLAGVAINGYNNATVRNNKFTGNRTAIDINNSNGNQVHNNIIDFNRTGIVLRNSCTNNVVKENDIINNWTIGILWLNEISNDATGTIFFNNKIEGNWYTQIENRATSGGVRNFSGNWLGSAALTTANTNGSEPGYPALIPVEYGGTATPPGGAVSVRGAGLSLIDYTPWLNTNTDTNVDNGTGTIGFQGDFSYLWVDDDSAQYGTSGRIQEGVNLLTPGGTVHALNGTYVENVVLNKSLTLQGESQAGVIVYPALSAPNPCSNSSLCGGAASNVFLVEASNVTIHDLTVNGDNPALTSGVVRSGADLDARNGIIANIGGPYNNLVVFNVMVKNIYLRGIQPSAGGTFNIHHNTVQNVNGDTASIAIFNFGASGVFDHNVVSDANDGIAANWSRGTQFTNNILSDVSSGIHTDNSGSAAGSSDDLIQGNTISNCKADG